MTSSPVLPKSLVARAETVWTAPCPDARRAAMERLVLAALTGGDRPDLEARALHHVRLPRGATTAEWLDAVLEAIREAVREEVPAEVVGPGRDGDDDRGDVGRENYVCA